MCAIGTAVGGKCIKTKGMPDLAGVRGHPILEAIASPHRGDQGRYPIGHHHCSPCHSMSVRLGVQTEPCCQRCHQTKSFDQTNEGRMPPKLPVLVWTISEAGGVD